jgi:tripartite-type tricarboxylate transporter receptor subunit TctC
MTHFIDRRRALMVLACAAATLPAVASAQSDFPNKSIRVIVPFAAGSGADGATRVIAEQMQRTLGQTLVVENRPGGSGAVAVLAVKQAPADGYTILVGTNSPMSVNPIVMKNPGYDSVKDFKPVNGILRSMNVWYVANESPIRSIPDLITAARSKPVSVGSYSAGYHLGIEWVATLGGVKVNYVNYKGQAQAITDVIGRALDVGMGDMSGALPLIQSGKIRAIGVSGATRHPGLPTVPAIRETFPEYENYAWTSFFVRAETPPEVHGKLVAAMQAALRSPEMKRYFEVNGSDPMVDFGPDRMSEHLRQEIARFRRVADAAGIKAE